MNYTELAKEMLDVMMSAPCMKFNKSLENIVGGGMYVLGYLYYHDNKAYPKDMSEGMAVTSARMAVILNNLEKEGYVKRSMDYVDNRKTVVSLTEAGLSRIKEEDEITVKHLTSLLEALGEDDAKEYLRLLNKISDLYK